MTDHDQLPRTSDRSLSGRWVVVGMFAFALTAVGIMYAYWHLHRAPFVGLQRAIVAEFPESAPRVEGGRRKMHEDTPRILRIVFRVPVRPGRVVQEATPAGKNGPSRNEESSRRRVPMTAELDVGSFDLRAESAERRMNAIVDRLQVLASGELDLSAYDRLDVHFFQPVPEGEIRQRTVRRDLSE